MRFRPRQRSGSRLGDGVDQQACRERLVQECDTADLVGFAMQRLIVDAGHENHSNFRAACQKTPTQLNAGHAAQLDIEHKARRATDCLAAQKGFGRRKAFNFENPDTLSRRDSPFNMDGSSSMMATTWRCVDIGSPINPTGPVAYSRGSPFPTAKLSSKRSGCQLSLGARSFGWSYPKVMPAGCLAGQAIAHPRRACRAVRRSTPPPRETEPGASA